jgi:hypothetical protein
MNFSNALTTLARVFAGLSNFTGSEPATRKLPPERASALPALVHKPPFGGVVISSGRYSNANELRMIAPNSKAVVRAAFSIMIAAPDAIMIAPKTHDRKVCAGIHAGNLGKTRVTKSR